MQSDQYLYNIDDVSGMFKCAKSTIWRWVSAGTFPKPIKIGGTSRWTQPTLAGVIDAAQQNNIIRVPKIKQSKPRLTKLSRK